MFRLAVITVEMPALSERREDIPLLVASFLKELAPAGTPAAEVTPAAMEFLTMQPWKGNVRELRNAMHRALVMSRGQPIEVSHILPPRSPAAAAAPAPAGATLEEIEKQAMREALESNKGNKMRSARSLGISVTTLKKKIRDYGLPG